MKRVLIVEDNSELAFGLRNNLEIDGYVVDVAEDGSEALEAVGRFRPHAIILDAMLPKIDGFHVLRSLRQRGDTTPVLMLTARGEELDKVRGLKLGADDYVTKPFSLLELLARVEALLRRGTRGDTLGFGEVVVDRDTRTVSRSGEAIALSPKEIDLLLALLDRGGRIVSREELMKEVWGYADSVITRTVDTHILTLRRKLETDPANPRHILTVKKIGYRLQR
jgi:two-component system, OmpR family, alkaline phosphatase synthesis response regulator PhoP